MCASAPRSDKEHIYNIACSERDLLLFQRRAHSIFAFFKYHTSIPGAYRKEAELFEKVRPAAKAKAASITQISHGLQTTTPFVNQTPSLALYAAERAHVFDSFTHTVREREKRTLASNETVCALLQKSLFTRSHST